MSNIKEIIESLNNSYGFILSYGESSEFIPVETFKVKDILKEEESPYKQGLSNERDLVIKLVGVNNHEKQADNVIYIPLKEFIKIFYYGTEENNYSVRELVNSEIYEDQLSVLNIIAQQYYRKHKTSPINFYQTSSLDDINATYEVNGNAVGTNYTFVPFSYGKQKRKTLYFDPEKRLNNLSYKDFGFIDEDIKRYNR